MANGPGVKADAIGTEWCRYSNYHVPWIVAYGIVWYAGK